MRRPRRKRIQWIDIEVCGAGKETVQTEQVTKRERAEAAAGPAKKFTPRVEIINAMARWVHGSNTRESSIFSPGNRGDSNFCLTPYVPTGVAIESAKRYTEIFLAAGSTIHISSTPLRA